MPMYDVYLAPLLFWAAYSIIKQIHKCKTVIKWINKSSKNNRAYNKGYNIPNRGHQSGSTYCILFHTETHVYKCRRSYEDSEGLIRRQTKFPPKQGMGNILIYLPLHACTCTYTHIHTSGNTDLYKIEKSSLLLLAPSSVSHNRCQAILWIWEVDEARVSASSVSADFLPLLWNLLSIYSCSATFTHACHLRKMSRKPYDNEWFASLQATY